MARKKKSDDANVPTPMMDRVVAMANGSLKGGDPPPMPEKPTGYQEEDADFRRKLALFDREIETLRVNADGARKIAREAVACHKHAVEERNTFVLRRFEPRPLFDPSVEEPALESVADAAGEVS